MACRKEILKIKPDRKGKGKAKAKQAKQAKPAKPAKPAKKLEVVKRPPPMARCTFSPRGLHKNFARLSLAKIG